MQGGFWTVRKKERKLSMIGELRVNLLWERVRPWKRDQIRDVKGREDSDSLRG